MDLLTQTGSTLKPDQQDLLTYLGRFQSVLAELQESHARLESKAKRMEVELEASNNSLETQIAESERANQFLEAILASLPTGVVVRDAEQHIVRTNLAARNILGMSDAELLDDSTPLPLTAAKDASDWIPYCAPCGTERTQQSKYAGKEASSGNSETADKRLGQSINKRHDRSLGECEITVRQVALSHLP